MKKYLKETAKYLLRSPRRIRKYIDAVEGFYAMTSQELAARNEERFLYIFRRAITLSPFYKQFYGDAGITIDSVHSLADIQKLPILTKEMIKAHGKEMRIPGTKLLENHTSGTTGSPLCVWENWESICWEQAYFYCYRRRCGYLYGKDVLASLRGNLSKDETSMYVHASKTLFLSSYNLKPEAAHDYYQQIVKHKPKAIEGYPSALYSLACLFEEQGLNVEIPVSFTSSENLLDYQREKIQSVFHTELFDHYGTTERTIRLEEAFNHDGYFEDPGYSINEYLEDGEITTGLINADFPMIRYLGSDVVEVDKASGKILGVKGRSGSCLVGLDGSRYNAAALTFIVKDCKTLKGCQFVQHKGGKVDLNVVAIGDAFSDADKKHILQLIETKCGKNAFDLQINQVDESDLIYSSRGKFSYVIQEMQF